MVCLTRFPLGTPGLIPVSMIWHRNIIANRSLLAYRTLEGGPPKMPCTSLYTIHLSHKVREILETPAPESIRRPRSPPERVVQIQASVCELPATCRLPRLSCADLVREAQPCGIVTRLSRTTVWRWLTEDAIPGSIAPRSSRVIRSSRSRPAASSICTPGAG